MPRVPGLGKEFVGCQGANTFYSLMGVKLDRFKGFSMAGSKTEKPVENASETLERPHVLGSLRKVLDLAISKLGNRYTSRKDKLAWSRIVASAAAASAGLLRDKDLDSLSERLKVLEEASKSRRGR